MVRDEEKYQLATYYRKRGFSYSEVAKIVGVSKGTLSAWFAKKQFSKKVKKDNVIKAGKENVKRVTLLNKARNKEREKVYVAARKQAEVEYKHYKLNPLFMAGLMLYVGVGDHKQNSLIRLSNSRTGVHGVFIKFAIDFLGVTKDQIHFWLLLYPAMSEAECMRVWSKTIKLPTKQFYKTQVVQGKSSKETLQYGVGNTIISSTVLKHKLSRWIELATKELQK